MTDWIMLADQSPANVAAYKAAREADRIASEAEGCNNMRLTVAALAILGFDLDDFEPEREKLALFLAALAIDRWAHAHNLCEDPAMFAADRLAMVRTLSDRDKAEIKQLLPKL